MKKVFKSIIKNSLILSLLAMILFNLTPIFAQTSTQNVNRNHLCDYEGFERCAYGKGYNKSTNITIPFIEWDGNISQISSGYGIVIIGINGECICEKEKQHYLDEGSRSITKLSNGDQSISCSMDCSLSECGCFPFSILVKSDYEVKIKKISEPPKCTFFSADIQLSTGMHFLWKMEGTWEWDVDNEILQNGVIKRSGSISIVKGKNIEYPDNSAAILVALDPLGVTVFPTNITSLISALLEEIVNDKVATKYSSQSREAMKGFLSSAPDKPDNTYIINEIKKEIQL